ncbi:MAG TPA: DUF523 and DUF1722 domain-containing protein [Candidatus Thermoplasmatota archaeon]|nr:DUF523 and DUF1722 domain-containing protein [Candidatus Thermoplasmatota archaeon]
MEARDLATPASAPFPSFAEHPRLGISACLLGDAVRYNGGHARDVVLTETFAPYFDWVPVCPEVEVGMGAPRETVHLEATEGARSPRLVAPKSGTDWTDRMRAYSEARVAALRAQGLHGYILKKDSPSCGMERVRVHFPAAEHAVKRTGRGLFAEALLRAWPQLPVEEEGRLRNLALRENFVERVYCYQRWTRFLETRPRPGDLVEFHKAHRYALRAHSPRRAKALGQLVAHAGVGDFDGLLRAYGDGFMACLREPATVKRHADVLYHLLGYVKGYLGPEQKREVVDLVEDFRLGRVPLVVPLALLKHHLREHPDPWVAAQIYLDPYPAELRLRSHLLEPRSDHLGG